VEKRTPQDGRGLIRVIFSDGKNGGGINFLMKYRVDYARRPISGWQGGTWTAPRASMPVCLLPGEILVGKAKEKLAPSKKVASIYLYVALLNC
jgi:hypothetical protein